MSRLQQTKQQDFLFNRARFALVGLIALATPAIGLAADYTVTTATDTLANHTPGTSVCGTPCSLRAAVMASNVKPGADNILLGIINPALFISGSDENSSMTGDLDITDNVNIIGQGSSRNIINASGMADRVFHILASAQAKFEHVSIQGGAIEDNTGAGIYVAGASTIELTDVELTNNTVSLVIEEPSFEISGGGLAVEAQATAIIESSSINNNTAPIGGGINNLGRTDIRTTLIEQNTASGTGDIVLDRQKNAGNGGGINNLGGYLSIGNSDILNNHAANNGGGLFQINQGLNVGNMIITNTSINENTAFSNGAGIANIGPLTLSHVTVGRNIITDEGNGAGIFNSGTAKLDIVNSTISSNTGARSGGGIFNSRDMTLNNVTIYNNSATPSTCIVGTDVDCSENNVIGGNQLTVFKTTANTNPSAVISNSILANGPNSNITEAPCAGSTDYKNNIESLGNSIENDNTCGLINANDKPGTVVNIDPDLAVDPDYPNTTAVHALLDGSPAIDTASNSSCPTVDQRFLLRDPLCDIGSYEANANQQQTSDLVDLKVTITDNPDPVAPNTIQPLNYVVSITNLYVDNPANAVRVSIELPDSYLLSDWAYTSSFATRGCSFANWINTIFCNISSFPGLGRVEIFISGQPTVEGTITARADVFSGTVDSFPQNNVNITEATVVSVDGGNPPNFGGIGDSDGDGVKDDIDAFPFDASETKDTDGDGVGDNADVFPNDGSETIDTDGDGTGDNSDAFPNDVTETADTDNDGVGDSADIFPTDASETMDSDGDGTGDNSDAFPNDASKSTATDGDGDGVSDNADAVPNEAATTDDELITDTNTTNASGGDGGASSLGIPGILIMLGLAMLVRRRGVLFSR